MLHPPHIILGINIARPSVILEFFTSSISGRGNSIRPVCVCVCVCGSYLVHHFVGTKLGTKLAMLCTIDLHCAPRPALCTMVHKGDLTHQTMDFWANGLYMGRTQEVRECSRVFISPIMTFLKCSIHVKHHCDKFFHSLMKEMNNVLYSLYLHFKQ